MATYRVFAQESATAVRPAATSPAAPSHRLLSPGRRAAACCLVAAALAPAAVAQVPGMPSEEGDRAWYTAFMTRFNARVLPSFRVDPEVQSRVKRVWEAMLARIAGGRERQPSPLDQYPLLGFVDDRFVVMKVRTPEGDQSFVVRSEEALAMPTLTSTLVEYLDGTIYPSLRAIADEERARIAASAGYEPRLDQLAAQNPYQHGMPIRVPEMGPFKNRMVVFTGLGGRLTASDVADYEAHKWNAGDGKVVGVMRSHRWGVAIELADLEREGRVECRYRFVREVAAVRDTFVGEGRRGVLLRQPRLGPVVEVSGCLADCDAPESWTPIYPEPGERNERRQPPRRGPSLLPLSAGSDLPGEPPG